MQDATWQWLVPYLRQPTVAVPIAAKALGVGVNQGYEAARNGDIEVIRLGPKRMVVPSVWLMRKLHIRPEDLISTDPAGGADGSSSPR